MTCQWEHNFTYEVNGAMARSMSNSLSLCGSLIPILLADSSKEMQERKSLKQLTDVVKEGVYFRVPTESATEVLPGIRGILQCVLVALTDYIPAFEDKEGHVSFKNLIGDFTEVEDNDVVRGKQSLYSLTNHQVCSFFSLALSQIKPYEGLNENALCVLRTMCEKSHWTEKDTFLISDEDAEAAKTVADFVNSLIPMYEDGNSFFHDNIVLGGYVLLKKLDDTYQVAVVTESAEKEITLHGAITKV